MKMLDRINSFFGASEKKRRFLTAVALSLAGLLLFGLVVFRRMNPALWILAALALLSAALWVTVNIGLIRRWSGAVRRTTDPNRSLYILLIASILIVVNIISVRQHFRLDLTSTGSYTLSKQSVKILKEMKAPLEIVFFRTDVEQNKRVLEVLRLYERKSGSVKLKIIDPDDNPVLAKQYDLQPAVPGDEPIYSSIYLLSGRSREKVQGLAADFYPASDGRFQQVIIPAANLERRISSAILRLEGPRKKVYFLAGHAENDMDDTGKNGSSRLKAYIGQENYDIDELVLADRKQVPSDCALLIGWGGKRPLDDREANIISDYLSRGGRLIVGTDPLSASGWNRVISKWGFWFNGDLVIDPTGSYWYRADVPFVKSSGYSPMTENLRAAVVFPQACSIGFTQMSNVSVFRPLRASAESWGEQDLKQDPPVFEEGRETKGGLLLAVYAEKRIDQDRRAAVAAFGDTDFVNNSFIDIYGNLDLFMNAVNSLADKKELNTIRSRDSATAVMELDRLKLNIIFALCVILLPLAAVVAGILVFLRRRR